MYKHCGLFFSEAHIEQAHRQRHSEPFQSAFLYLHDREQDGAAAAQWYGLRCRFNDDEDAGAIALAALEKYIDQPLSEDITYLDTVGQTLMLAQSFELLRDHPGWSLGGQTRWLNLFQDRVTTLSTSPYKDTQVENLWMAALVMAAGVLLERDDLFDLAVEQFQRQIDTEISPRGHIPKAVEGKDGGGLYRQILSVSALVLMAEMASHCEVDLWQYNNRGVSVTTAAIYPIYYFYTVEKWQWDTSLTVDDVQLLFRRCGGYLEMVNHHAQFRDLKPLLEDLRPIYDAHGGGLTTLTHGVPVVKRRGLFG